jgi:protein-S-isoprenylcysteine O-methyltransferase Ste14
MTWQRIARRIRVPAGFLFAVGYLYFARPAWWAIGAGAVIAAMGLTLRAIAAGHVRKDRELTTVGPYAHTRNPLYLGSILIAGGFALSARNWWIALAIVIFFILVYVPVIRAEEEDLRSQFAEYSSYEERVPRLIPKIEGAAGGLTKDFSRELYLRHREYRALAGAALMLVALAIKLMWFNR